MRALIVAICILALCLLCINLYGEGKECRHFVAEKGIELFTEGYTFDVVFGRMRLKGEQYYKPYGHVRIESTCGAIILDPYSGRYEWFETKRWHVGEVDDTIDFYEWADRVLNEKT